MTGKFQGLDAIFNLPNTSLEIKEQNFSSVGIRTVLLSFTDDLATQFGALSGGLFLADILGQDQVLIYLSNAVSSQYAYLKYIPSTDELAFLEFAKIDLDAETHAHSLIVDTDLTVTNDVISTLKPKTTNTYDLGIGTGPSFLWRKWRDLWLSRNIDVDGIANIDDLRVDEALGSDLPMGDDKFIKVGKDSDGTLPTADASYRGKMIRVEGGAGVADKLYICMKSASDTYSWVQVASG